MAIIPTVRCQHLGMSVSFYTRVLDFIHDGPTADLSDPGFAVLRRGGDCVFLSSHQGDGAFGQAIVVTTEDADSLFRTFVERGLVPPSKEGPVHQGPTDQTWGTREFYVDDPDGNTLRFTQYPSRD